MLNNAIFSGGYEAGQALQEASLNLEIDTNWCVGGCASWKDTSIGRERYAELKSRHEVISKQEK
jgi:hypothetical protein